MKNISVWHGCQMVVWAAGTSACFAAPVANDIVRVNSKVFDVEYRVNERALPLASVRFWYTLDKGDTWQLYGQDDDRQSPIQFNAPEEGLYGFYFVAGNSAGLSGAPPQAGTDAQRWAYVDYKPPIVQLHKPKVDPRSATGNTIAVRWSAIDAHLPTRPISLSFRTAPEGSWNPIAGNLANTGRYDWKVKDALDGKIVLRISVIDQGGNRVEAATSFDLPSRLQLELDDALPPNGDLSNSASDARADAGSKDRARMLYQAATQHRDRGENELAMARLRDALKADPTLSIALVDLASLLHNQGHFPAALEAYQLSLRQNPKLRSGLEGSARVAIAQRQYGLASDFLRRILDEDPKDAATWMNLGDVSIYQGDELTARDYYQKATSVEPNNSEVIARARLRLANLPALRGRAARK